MLTRLSHGLGFFRFFWFFAVFGVADNGLNGLNTGSVRHLLPLPLPFGRGEILDQLGRIALVEVWFELRDGRQMCLPRITQPEAAQAVLLAQLKWTLPQQPPPRVYACPVPTATTPPSVAEPSV